MTRLFELEISSYLIIALVILLMGLIVFLVFALSNFINEEQKEDDKSVPPKKRL